MIQRKKHTDVSMMEWELFIDAVNSMHGTQVKAPKYRELVKIHVDAFTARGSSWGVHTMGGVAGRNFLAWHRQYLSIFEKRLQEYDSNVFIPYWDWANDNSPPQAISDQTLLDEWSVTRNFNPNIMPTMSMINYVNTRPDFESFQAALENVHNPVHRAVGGDMMSASSPSDPIFWLHHANIDRIWWEWQNSGAGEQPKNSDETMEPAQYLNVKVESILHIADLNYEYLS